MEMLYQSQFNKEYEKYLDNNNIVAFNHCMNIVMYNVNAFHLTIEQAKEELKNNYRKHLEFMGLK